MLLTDPEPWHWYVTTSGKTVDGLKQAIVDAATKQLDQAVADKLITAAQEQTILAYHLKLSGRAGQQLVGRLFERQNYGIGLQENSPLRKPINSALLKLRGLRLATFSFRALRALRVRLGRSKSCAS